MSNDSPDRSRGIQRQRTPRQIKSEVEEEIRFHLELRIAELVRQGLSPAEAREEAVRMFGDVERTERAMSAADQRRERRDRRREYLREVLQDLKHAQRQLRRRPGFALVTVLTLALGIGATTAVFSAADHVILRPLPYVEADRVVALWEIDTRTGQTRKEISPGNYLDWRERTRSFESMALIEPWGFDLSIGDDPPEAIRAWAVTEGFFETIGARPILGRGFLPEEHAPNAPQVVVISQGLWQRRFGSDPGIVGQAIRLDFEPATVVGIAPAFLQYPDRREIWNPKRWYRNEAADRRSSYMMAVGRLRSDVTMEQARAELDAVANQLADEYPATNTSIRINAVPLDEQILGSARPALFVLLIAVVFVLLIACANVASLMLARATERERELAVRAALGAGRSRLLRQLITESVLIAAAAGTAGIAFAYLGVRILIALSPPDLPRVDTITLDGRILLFALALTALTALLFGLAPALRASRVDLLTPLRAGGRSIFGSRERNLLRRALVGAEVALALMLLIGAGLLGRSLRMLIDNDVGFATENRASLQVFLWDLNPTAEQRLQRIEAIREALLASPAVDKVAVVTALPFHPSAIDPLSNLVVEGRAPPPPGEEQRVYATIASPEYFELMGIPLRAGRPFTAADRADAPRVALVSETLARRYFPGEDPIGKVVRVGVMAAPRTWEIVGVVGDVRPRALDSDPRAELFVPLAQTANGSVTFVVKTRDDPAPMMPALRAALWSAAPNQSIYHEATVKNLIASTLVERRFHLVLLRAFSFLALVVATAGIYGLIGYSMSQRTNEISVRMAMGARAQQIVRMVVTDGLKLAVPGVVLGLCGAMILTRFIATMLYEVRPTEPVVYVQIVGLVLIVAAIAAFIPARRAASIDPARALREE